MKVITLKQPWATLIAEGYKKYEFRSWSIKHRGPILIHVGKGIDQEAMKKFEHLHLSYPQSCLVAQVEIIDCILLNTIENKKIIAEDEFIYGHDLSRSGYAWKLDQVTKIESDGNIKGKQGIWYYEK